jgi:hypothetical protein
MKAMFSDNLCRPPKGGAGELFGALFLLFCMDEIRKEVNDEENQDYRIFSVPLDKWLRKILKDSVSKVSHASDSSKIDTEEGSSDCESSVERYQPPKCQQRRRVQSSTVNFVQVCRNYLRYPFLQSLDARYAKAMFKQSFLECLYKSAIGFYTYPCCPRIDIFASIMKCDAIGACTYWPLLVSVKARKDYTFAEAKERL